MAVISYLNNFPADSALEILVTHGEHEVVRIDSHDSLEQCFSQLARTHAYQCIGARDEVPAGLRVDAEFLAKTPNLLVVSASGSGVDVFDLDACTKAGVLAVNQAGSNAESVAEHALAMMISLLKNLAFADHALRRGWDESRMTLMGRDLMRRTVGIVGVGNIGRRVAEICHTAFQCEVLAYDPYLTSEQVAARHAQQVSFDDLLARSEIITVHTPLTPETYNLFDQQVFSAMQPGAIFICTARGSIQNEQALTAALQSGHLHGAGLDVWDKEPPAANHPLLNMDNVIASPHVAGCTADSLENMARYAATQLIDIFDGKPPQRPVNEEVLPKFYERLQRIMS